jgi:hypothetical protein
MSKVVGTKAIKQASLNLRDMADKGRIDLTQEDIDSILSEVTIIQNTRGLIPNFTWNKDVSKPYALEGVIEQIKSIFNVGKEVEGWSVKYYGPAQKNEKGKPSENELRIPPIEKGLGGRFVIVVGSREVPTLEVAVGSTGAENQYLMMEGDCMYLKITICPVLNVVFSNNFSEKLAPRKGFREMIIKKNPFNRHVFVVDAHVSMGALANKVKSELIGIASEETVERIFNKASAVETVAALASSSSSVAETKIEKE